jgi:hypothetical protein
MMFAVLDAVLLKPLPFADPERLMWIWATRTDRDKAFFSIPDYVDYRRAMTTLQDVAAYASWGVNLTGGGNPERLQGAKVTAGAFSALGVSAGVGRTLVATDDVPGADRIVVVTDALWRRRFGGARGIVGSRVQLNGEEYEVGASRRAMVSAVLGLAGRLLAVGVPLGLVSAALALQFVLSDAGPGSNDWSMWVLAPAVISGAAVAASCLCARRVLALDPALTSRSE